MKKLILAVVVGFIAVGAVEGSGYCSSCQQVDCSFDTQCGVRCSCVKLNGKIKGQCVEKW